MTSAIIVISDKQKIPWSFLEKKNTFLVFQVSQVVSKEHSQLTVLSPEGAPLLDHPRAHRGYWLAKTGVVQLVLDLVFPL